MKKKYYSIKPDSFEIYDEVRRDGKLIFKKYPKFDIEDSFFNKLFFESQRRSYDGIVILKEMFSQTKFELETFKAENDVTFAILRGIDIDIETKPIPLSKIEVESSTVTGFFNEVYKSDDIKIKYIESILQFIATCRAKTKQYIKDQTGPSKKLTKDAKLLAKRLY